MNKLKAVGRRMGQGAVIAAVMSALVCEPMAMAVDSTWTFNGDGNWNTGANWDNGEPINNTFNAIIDDGDTAVTVFLNVSRTINNLTIGSDDQLTFNNAQSLTIAGDVTNNGTILLNSVGNATELILGGASPDLTLSGSGKLVLGANANNRIRGTGTLTNGAMHTITGGGAIGSNAIDIVNNGVIEANAATMTIDPATILTNNATLRAVSGGSLNLGGGMYDNTNGTISAADASLVQVLNGAVVSGGNLSTSGSGSIDLFTGSTTKNLTITAGSLVRINNNQIPTLSGTITNNGTLQLNSIGNATDIVVDTALTLDGSGMVVMGGNINNRIRGTGTLINSATHTIKGGGQIGLNQIDVVNHGVVEANAALLSFDPLASVTNDGTLRASAGGTLEFQSGAYINTAGTILAQDASLVQIKGGAVVSNGNLSSTGSGAIDLFSGSGLQNVTLTAGSLMRIGNAQSTVYTGTFTNNGTFQINSLGNATDFVLNGDVLLTGNGNFAISSNVNNRVRGTGTLTVDTNAKISGGGQLGANEIGITNKNLIVADAGNTMTINPSAAGLLNNGTLRATTAGVLQLTDGTFTNNGDIEAQDMSVVNLLTGTTIVGGNLKTSGTGEIRITQNFVTLESTTLTSGSNLVINNDQDPIFKTLFTNNGTVHQNSLGNATDVRIDGSTTFAGSGTWAMSDNVNNRIFGLTAGDILTNSAAHTFTGSGQIGTGTIGLINNGTIIANNNSSNRLFINPGDADVDGLGSDVRNAGLMQADNNGILQLVGGVFNNNGGTIKAINDGEVELAGGATIFGGSLATDSGNNSFIRIVGNTVRLRDITLTTGSSMIINNDIDPQFEGLITLNGSLLQNSAGNSTDVHIVGNSTVTGTGVWTMSNSIQNRIFSDTPTDVLTIASGFKIQGAGQLGINSLGIINNGLIDANVSSTLTIDPSIANVINNSTLRASAGGSLQLTGGTFTNNGDIEAQDMSVVNLLSGATIVGGNFKTSGSGSINITQNLVTIQNATLTAGSTLNIANDIDPIFTGMFTNNGSVHQNSGGNTTDVRIDGDTTFTGNGTWTMSNTTANRMFAFNNANDVLTNAAGHTIQGAGQIGANSMGLINNGLIIANVSNTLTIDPSAGPGVVNNNILRASAGGTLQLADGTFTNNSTIEALDGSVVNLLAGATIVGGNLSTSGTGDIRITQNSVKLDHVTLTTGSKMSISNDIDPIFVGLFTNNGSVNQNTGGNNTDAQIQGDTTFAGNGVWNMNNGDANRIFAPDGTSRLTNGQNHTIQGIGQIGVNSMAITNKGVIQSNVAGRNITVDPANVADAFINDTTGIVRASNSAQLNLSGNGGGTFTNNGTFEVLGHGSTILTGNNATLTNLSGGVLSGGIYRVVDFDPAINTAPLMNFLSSASTAITTIGEGTTVEMSGVQAKFVAGTGGGLDLFNSLTTNNGLFKIYDNHTFNMANQLTNAGVVELGGAGLLDATLNSNGSIINNGEIFGHGVIADIVLNHGTVRAANGTLVAQGIIDGQSGTIIVDPGASLDLSGTGGDSDTDFLTHNGDDLNLGSHDLLVRKDYNNANFGSGNSFNKRANVSGTGQILASDPFTISTSGDVAFGNVHVGDVNMLSYEVFNDGTVDQSPDVRVAVQTAVNGGNITDGRISGAGASEGLLGPIAAGSGSGPQSVTFNATSAGALTGQTLHFESNFDNVAGTDLNITGAAFRYANPTAHSPEPVNFGNVRLGAMVNQNLSITNDVPNDGFSEALDASIATDGLPITASGSISKLAPGATNNASLKVGVDTSTAGAKSGTATISLASNGDGSSGLGITNLPSQTVHVTASVIRPAAASMLNDVNFGVVHVGDGSGMVMQNLMVTNTAANDGFSEKLVGSATTVIGGPAVSAFGNFNDLAPGASNNVFKVAADTSTAGAKSGTATFAFESNGSDFGFGTNIPLGVQTININAQVNNFAAPILNGLTGVGTLMQNDATHYVLDLGAININGGDALAMFNVANDAPAANSDTLSGAWNLGGATSAFAFSGFDPFSAVAGQTAQGGFSVTLHDAMTGTFSHTLTLSPSSDNASSMTALSPIELLVTGKVVGPILGASPNPVDFGAVLVGQTGTQTVTAENVGDDGSTLSGSFGAVSSPFAPASDAAYGPLQLGEQATRDYTFSPASRGDASDTLTITSNNNTENLTLMGKGVAPVAEAVDGDAGFVRIGSTGTATAKVNNIGDGNESGLGDISNLKGSLASSAGAFNGSGGLLNLTDGSMQAFDFTYTPTAHTTDSTNVQLALDNGNPDGSNSAITQNVALSGTGVGPVYDSTPVPSSIIDFGTVGTGAMSTRGLDIFNVTLDLPDDIALTGLSILDALISGPDADDFMVVGFVPGVIAKGGMLSLTLKFTGDMTDGLHAATLSILTDEDASFGGDGNEYQYGLVGNVESAVPMPGAGVIGLVLAGAAAVRRRRR
ncbi:MAG: choice-of-anchor D domain-containing protein [Planctomycetes bacterium]|nr:choice-of-anchor D domain-containing protein [Planctomycetota bacterium]